MGPARGYRIDKHWSLALNVANVFDKHYYSMVSQIRRGNHYGEPRNVMLMLRGASGRRRRSRRSAGNDVKPGFRQSMSWLHTWCGLSCGWLLCAIFLTGTLGVFREPITRWMEAVP